MTEPTDITPPPMPGTPPKAASTRKPFLAGVATGALVTALAAGGVFLVLDDSDQASTATGDSKSSTSASSAAQEPVEETTEPTEAYNDVPLTDHFKITLKTTRKQCFGSAGCNVTVDPELTYAGLLPPNPDKTYSITFEVRGGADGAIVQTMELTDQDQVSYRPVDLSTNKSGDTLTAKVTDVEISE